MISVGVKGVECIKRSGTTSPILDSVRDTEQVGGPRAKPRGTLHEYFNTCTFRVSYKYDTCNLECFIIIIN